MVGQDNPNFGIWLDTSGNTIGPAKAGLGANEIVGADNAAIYIQGNNNLVQSNALHANASQGLQVDDGRTGNRFYANSTYNGGQGIDLHPFNAVNANDSGDGDIGANNGQNRPVLNSAVQGPKDYAISLTLNSLEARKYRIDLYATDSVGECDDTSRQTRRWLGMRWVSTPTDSTTANATLKAKAPAGFTPQGFTATATDSITGDTSEISNCVQPGA